MRPSVSEPSWLNGDSGEMGVIHRGELPKPLLQHILGDPQLWGAAFILGDPQLWGAAYVYGDPHMWEAVDLMVTWQQGPKFKNYTTITLLYYYTYY